MFYYKLGLLIYHSFKKKKKILPPPIAKVMQSKNFKHFYLETMWFCVFKLIKNEAVLPASDFLK